VQTLIVLRHAKSDWSGDESDHDRPLAKRGRRQAPKAGAWLAAHAGPIDLAVVSSAARAQQTWALASAELDRPPRQHDDERLYAVSGRALKLVLDEVAADLGTVVLVAHNPGVEDLVHQLTGTWVALPTSAIAVVDVPSRRLVTSGRPPA
jgi:phosphohistidine phosphatase